MKKEKTKNTKKIPPYETAQQKRLAQGNGVSTQPPNGLPLYDPNPNDHSDFDPSNYQNI